MAEAGRRRRRVGLADEREQVELLCACPKQRNYGEIKLLVLFGEPVAGRAEL